MALALQPSTTTLSPRPPTAHRSPQRAKPTFVGLTPTHDRGPGPPGGRSTWLLLSPRCRRAAGISAVVVSPGWRVAQARLCFGRPQLPLRLCFRVMGAADALLVIAVLADDAEWPPESVSMPR